MTMSDAFGFDEDPFKSHDRRSAPKRVPSSNSSRNGGDERRRSSKSSSDQRPARPARSSSLKQEPPAFEENAFGYEDHAPAPKASAGRRQARRRASVAGAGVAEVSSSATTNHSDAFSTVSDDCGYGGAEPSAPSRPRRTRRSSMYGDAAGGAPSTARSSASSSSSRGNLSSARSCDGLETMRVTRSDGPPRPVRRGRRASICATQAPPAAEPDYGYQEGSGAFDSPSNEFGYGDAAPSGFGNFDNTADDGYGDPEESAPKDQEWLNSRSENQRKLLDDFRSGGATNGNLGASSSRNLMSAQNVVLPMAVPEKPQQRPRRRASLIGVMGGGAPKAQTLEDDDKKKSMGLGLFKDRKASRSKSSEQVPQYDPSQDRERRAGNSLLERVNAGASTRSVSAGGPKSSYSDRILEGR